MNTNLTKAILYVYPTMKRLAEATRVGARNKALLSYRSRAGAMHDLEAVAQEMLLADRLEELQEEIDALLATLSEEELLLLEYRYFRRKNRLAQFKTCIECSERSYFRKQERLLKKIASRLLTRGINEQYFQSAFKGCSCLMKVYRAIANGKEQKIYTRRERRMIAFHSSSFSGGELFLPCATNMATTSTATADSVIKTIWTADRLSEFFPAATGASGSGR